MAKKEQKTRPDLGDHEWLAWLGSQPENRGIDVRAMHRKMFDWCRQKRVTPTRRRLLRWLDSDREAMPMKAAASPPKPASKPQLPDCVACGNERFIRTEVYPDAQYDWMRWRMLPCSKCNAK
ncbi:MAG TPA: hypothetical protein PLR83_00095 [Pyrinomonadaceae bacterium]|nr:hypothetical protein [Pyrinomonadaceae bacterium]